MFFMLKNVAKRRFNRSFKAIAMDCEVDDLSSSMTLKAASALFHFNIDIMHNLWHGVSTIDDFLLQSWQIIRHLLEAHYFSLAHCRGDFSA